MKKLLQSKKRGSAIPLVVVALLILLAMGTGLLSLGLNSRIFSIRTTSDIMARCAADAGLTMALFRMNEKSNKSGSGMEVPYHRQLMKNCPTVMQHIVTQLQATSPKAILLSPLEEPIRPREQSMPP